MTKVRRSFALCCALVFSAFCVTAEEIRDYYSEPGLNPFKDALNQHFNEHVDPFSGTLQLKYTDLSIPGNGGMDINITRVYTSLQRDQILPINVNGLGWTMHFGRIVVPQDHANKICIQAGYPLTTRDNPSLELPDGGRELLVLNETENDGSLITRSNWRADCLSDSSGMVVTSPNGTRYTMNRLANFDGQMTWYTTRIEDTEGNWIRIEYRTSTLGITYIYAVYRSEEGDASPVVRYEYESENNIDIRLSSITANGQTIRYRYQTIPGFLYPYYSQLVEVERPDNQTWEYAYNPQLADIDPNDGVIEPGPGSYSLVHVKYPYDAVIDYTYQYVAFDPGSSSERTTAIHTKEVSGPDVVDGEWTYTFMPYSEPIGSGGLRYDVTSVRGPTEIQRFYHFGKDFNGNSVDGYVYVRPALVGLLGKKEIYSRTNNALLERTVNSWGVRRISQEDFWHGSGYRNWWRDNATYVPILIGEYTNRDSRANNSTFNHYKQYFDYDAYGNPGRIYESSNLNERPARQTRLTYRNDTTRWILGLVTDEIHEEVPSSGTTRTINEVERVFTPSGKLLSETSLGIETKYTYTSDGDVETVEDARGKIRRYSNYKRGIPRREELPESVVITREVNNTGTVASETNGRGYTTSFDYDDLNRLRAIDFPIKADVSITYSAGGTRTLTRANYRQSEEMNDFGQVIRIERHDALTNQTIYRTNEYDASGRQVFTSYPNSTAGIRTTYDALGRVRRTEHPDGTGIDYQYDDAEIVVTNERGFSTTYRHFIGGVDFAGKSLSYISAPENVGTIIRKNSFDNTTEIFQGERQANNTVRGYGKSYEYNDKQFLVRSVEPEVGTTVFTHDEVGNVLTERVNDNQAISFAYDDLNRRERTDFADDTPDVIVIYDRNGNIGELIKGTTHWRYAYDENDNLTRETLEIGDTLLGTRTYATAYAHSDLDVLSQITYPSGLIVDYAPDAFGRATRVGTFASQITYHPSGQLQSYRLANGVTTNVSLNARLLTERINTGSLVDLQYTYDSLGNVTSILDGVDSSKSVRMTDANSYDGLDRLLAANGPWGAAQFSYDVFGNIRTKTIGTDSVSSFINAQRRPYLTRRMNASEPNLLDATINAEFDSRGNQISSRHYNLVASAVALDRKDFIFDASSNLVRAKVWNGTAQATASAVDKHYVYDGNGQRSLEKKHRSYDLRFSVHSRSGQLLFEDSIADCTWTDYIRLGALTIARSDDQRFDPAIDSDGDTINDCLERQVGLNPNDPSDANADLDGDGLSNLLELGSGSSLLARDTDGDGLSDLQERNQYLTDPTLTDSDGDGLSDAVEAGDSRVDPVLADKDHDGVSDYWELQLQTDPQNPSDGRLDTDGDGFSNRQESLVGLDPVNATRTPARGRRAWVFDTLGRIYSSAAIDRNGIVYVTANEHLYAINPDGTERWRYSVAQSSLSAPTIATNGTVYVVAYAGERGVHAVNPDGTRRWYFQSGLTLQSEVALGPSGRVYFTGYSMYSDWSGIHLTGSWNALDENGQRVGGSMFNDSVHYAPAVGADGRVYLVDGSGTFRVFESTGWEAWSLPLGLFEPAQPPIIGPNNRIYVADNVGRTLAIVPHEGIVWTRQSPDNATRSTVTIGPDGTLYVGAYDSKLYAVSPQDGTTIWTANTYGTSYTPAIGRDGAVYVTTWGGSVTAFSPAGAELWRYDTDIPVSAPPVIDRDGTIYFGSRAGQLVAVVDNSGGLARTPWPMSRHDSAGTAFVCFNNDEFSTTADTDADGIDDCAEMRYGLDPSNPSDAALDRDADGLTNAQEHAAGTSLDQADTDGDGLNDGLEVLTHRTDPNRVDSDNDSLSDGQEVQHGLNPLNAADALEDADGDGFNNQIEIRAGSNPRDASSRPAAGALLLETRDYTLSERAPALAADGTIYQLSADGQQLEALNSDFTLKWSRPGRPITDPVVGPDGTIFFVGSSLGATQSVFALYPNGEERWSYQISTDAGVFYNVTPVVAADGSLFVSGARYGANTNNIIAFDSSGRLKWGESGVTFLGFAPLMSIGRGGELIAFNGTAGVAAYRADTGQMLWSNTAIIEQGGSTSLPPVIDGDQAIYLSFADKLVAIDPANGAVRWQYDGTRGHPVITREGLILQYCQTPAGQLCALSRDGQLAWTTTKQEGFTGTPTIGSDGTIYAVNVQDGLNALDGNGAERWRTQLPSYSSVQYPVLRNDGTIYISGNDFRAVVVANSVGLAADSPWPARFRDHRNSRNALGVTDSPPAAVPSIGIRSPNNGAPLTIDVGTPTTFTAYANDFADGDLGASIVWSSNVEGALGVGASLQSPPLRVGDHIVTASVTDTSGLTSSVAMNVSVGSFPPELQVHAPQNGATAEYGQPVTLRASAHDGADGDISDTIEWSSSINGALGTGRELTISTLQTGAHDITARVTDSRGQSVTRSVQISVAFVPPEVSIYYPYDNSSFEPGTSITFEGWAQDAADGNLSSTLEWSSDRDGLIGTGPTVSMSALSTGAHVISARSRDSSGAETVRTIRITIGHLPPNLYLSTPRYYVSVPQGTAIDFEASADDVVDGDVSENIQWLSPLDGLLGTGSSFTRSDLSVGTHLVTVKVTDSAGLTDSETVWVVVTSPDNTAPFASINAPETNSEFYFSDAVALSGRGFDNQDGVINAVQWFSDLDGAIGTGATLNISTLRIGTHTIRALVTDSAGAKGAATIQLRILPIPSNYPPVVKMTSIGVGAFYTANSTIPLTGTVSDRESGDLSGTIIWSSDVDGELGRGAAIYTSLTAGEHVITATATDPGGAVGRKSMTITVNADGEAYHVFDTFSVATGPNYLAGWQIVEDGALLWPSAWYVSSGAAVEFAGTYRGSTTASVIDKPGTYLLQTTGTHWTDYRVNATLRSPDNDGIGLMFRVQDNNNYYRFSMDSERNFRRLVKKVNGTFSTIWQAAAGYTANQTYELEVIVQGTTITISLDGEQIYSGSDTSHRRGTIALYSWNNQGSVFDNVEVANLTGPNANNAPTVEITSPASGASVVAGTLVTFNGIAADVEDGSLSSTISWSSNLDGQLGTGGRLSTSTLSVGTHTVTATSRDSRNATATANVIVVVNERVNAPPVLSITAPATGASFTQGANITFTGTATDPEDGTISNGIAWSSSLDGALGTGASLPVNWLRVGTHSITASITDSEGRATTQTLAVTVTQFVNQMPVVTITAPASGGTYTSGTLISFAATATDAEDGNLAALITWASDRDGAIGSTGSFSTSTLSVGVHSITASVRDSMSATHSRTITLTIGAAPPTLMSDDFTDGNYTGWTVVTEGTTSGPAAWSASTGALRQTSGVYGGSTTSSSIARPGTFAHFAAGSTWTNYTVEADLRTSDPDSIGLMFRYRDNNNYYRFSMDRTLSQRRLVKKVNGTFTVLRQDAVRFNTNQTYRLSIRVNGSSITVSIDGVQFYSGTDSSVSTGSVAFYTWRNSGATFDNVTVRGIAPTANNLEINNPLSEPLLRVESYADSDNTMADGAHEWLADASPPLRSGGGIGWGQTPSTKRRDQLVTLALLESSAPLSIEDTTMTRSLQ